MGFNTQNDERTNFLMKKYFRANSTKTSQPSNKLESIQANSSLIVFNEEIYSTIIPSVLPTFDKNYKYVSSTSVNYNNGSRTITISGTASSLYASEGLTIEIWQAFQEGKLYQVDASSTVSHIVKISKLNLSYISDTANISESPSYYHIVLKDCIPSTAYNQIYPIIVEGNSGAAPVPTSTGYSHPLPNDVTGNWYVQSDAGILQFFDENAILPGTSINLFANNDQVSGTELFNTGKGPGITFYKYIGSKGPGIANMYTSSNNIGIGTTAPISALHICGNLSTVPTAAGIHMGFVPGTTNRPSIEMCASDTTQDAIIDFTTVNADSKGRVYYHFGNNYMGLNTNGTEKVRIDINGNVGIGSSSPSAKLDISGGVCRIHRAVGATASLAAPATNGIGERLILYDNGNGQINLSIGIDTGSMWFNTNTAENFKFYNAGALKTNISNGSVYIPNGGSYYITGDTSLTTASGTNCLLRHHSTGGNVYIDFVGNTNWRRSSDGVQLLTLDSSGNLTSTTSINTGGSISAGSYITGGTGIRLKSGRDGTATTSIFNVQYTGSVIVYIDVTPFTVQTTGSDYRIKNNISPLTESGLQMINKLKPVTFAYIDRGTIKSDNKLNYGFIAHEVEEAIYNSTYGEKDAIDENGNMLIQSLNLMPIISVLTKAVQELSSKNDNLKTSYNNLQISYSNLETINNNLQSQINSMQFQINLILTKLSL